MSSQTPAPSWYEIVIQVPLETTDDLAACLLSAGASGVEIIEPGLAPPPLAGPEPPPRPAPQPGHGLVVASYLASPGSPDPGTFTADEAREVAREALAELGLDASLLPEAAHLRTDTDWLERWKDHFRPRQLSPHLWVAPRWERQIFTPPKDHRVVWLDPGMAFGTGHHATTALCVALIEDLLGPEGAGREPVSSLLDVGCGSGILSFAALRWGLPLTVAVDNDPLAVNATEDNYVDNGFDPTTARCLVGLDVEDLPEGAPPTYPLVIANILAHILVALAPAVVARVAPGGRLILSGLLAEQEAEVATAYRQACETAGRTAPLVLETRGQEEWVALVLRLP